jgi:hypothetical protein
MLNGEISYIGIGSNLGDSLANCKEAVAGLSGIPETMLERVSSFYKTEPVTDFPVDEVVREVLNNQGWFTNRWRKSVHGFRAARSFNGIAGY